MSDQEFAYKGYRARISVKESGNESATGVFTSTITLWPDLPEGNGGDCAVVEKAAAHIFLSEAAADQAAADRARNAIDLRTASA